MAIIKAKGQITIIDQNDAVSFQAFIGSNQPLTQIYTQDGNSYTPNWSASPWLVLTPELYISGVSGNSISTAGRIKAGSAVWRKNGTVITAGANYVIGSTAPFSLTVKVNENTGGGNVKFEFSAIMVDPYNGLETNFTSVISFNTVMNAGSGLLAMINADNGTVFQNSEISSLTLACDLYRASTVLTSNVTYEWGIRDLKVFAPTTTSASSAVNATTVTLTSTTNVDIGSQLKIGTPVYTVTAINHTSKVATITPAVTTAIASGASVTCPHYVAKFGASWGKISTDAYFNGITGFATKTLVIPANAVLNLEVFKCIATDSSTGNSTSGQSAFAIETVNDMSDPIYIEISSPQGDVIKNGAGSVNLTAEVWRGGEEIDLAGTIYDYTWSRFDSSGTLVSAWVKTGKTIAIVPADVNGKATFVCKLYTKD